METGQEVDCVELEDDEVYMDADDDHEQLESETANTETHNDGSSSPVSGDRDSGRSSPNREGDQDDENLNESQEIQDDAPSQNVTRFRQKRDAEGNVTYEFVFNDDSTVDPESDVESLQDEMSNSNPGQHVDEPLEDTLPVEVPFGNENEVPSPWGFGGPANRTRGFVAVGSIARRNPWLSFANDDAPGPSRRRSNPRNSERSSSTPRRKKRRRKMPSKPKKRTQRVRKPTVEKPLKPVTHKKEVVIVGKPKMFASAIKLETRCPIRIDLETIADSDRGPRVGEMSIIFPEELHDDILDSDIPPESKEIILYVSEIPGRCVLQVTIEQLLEPEEAQERYGLACKNSKRAINNILVKKYFYHCDFVGIPITLFDKSSRKNVNKTLKMVIESASAVEWTVQVYLHKCDVLKEHTLSEIPVKRPAMAINLANYFFNVSSFKVGADIKHKEDIQWFYGQIKKYHEQENLPDLNHGAVEHSFLVPKLRAYQQKAVVWMLSREGHFNVEHSIKIENVFKTKMYRSVTLGSFSGYYNPFIGYFCSATPDISSLPSGGILADEMGLGKTVEMLALILLNPKPGSKFRAMKTEIVNDASEIEPENVYRSVKRKRSKSSRAKKSFSQPKRRRVRSETPEELLDDAVGSPQDESGAESPSCSQLLVKSLLSTKKKGVKGKKAKGEDDIIIKTNNVVEAAAQPEPETCPVPGKSKQGVLLKQMQSMYSAALSSFDAAADAKVKPRFHGKFYETSVDRKASFECVCGEFRGQSEKVVTCRKCSTSQHPKCVGELLIHRPAEDYVCPHCTVREDLLETSTTLIITPSSISYQWNQEIRKHVKLNNRSMNVLFYKGVSNEGYIPPAKLAEYDIVITTYSVLQTELNYTDLPHNNSEEGRKFRNPKRFMTIPSPLPCVNWWRICLDEAQMVEGIHTKMAMMAKRLKGVHKWCISGTPLNKGLQDLFGLFSFLEVSPIDDEFWWDNLVYHPFHRKETDVLYELFGRMIWRTGKCDVLDQLGIPPQTNITHWLHFSPIETHFYKQQLETCSQSLLQKISKLDSSISLSTKLPTLERSLLQKLLQPFLELRQACCHPQMVKGQLISLHKGTLTMEELLVQLIKKTALMCAEDHRLMVAAWNGMAGLHLIREEVVEASEMYRQVLQSAEKYKEHFPTDSLQLMHTMENLAEILDKSYRNVPYTLRDDSLRSDVEVLKGKYLEKYQNGVKNAVLALNPLTEAVKNIDEGFQCKKESWWRKVLIRAASVSKIDDLISRIKMELLDKADKKRKNEKSMANKFENSFGLEHILVENFTTLESCRQTVLESIEQLKTVEPAVMVDAAVECHLRNQSQRYYNDTNSPKCTLCTYHDDMIQYASHLFWEDTKAAVVRTGRKWQQNKLMGNLAEDLTQEEKEIALMREQEELFESTEHVQLYVKTGESSWQDSDTEKTVKILSTFARCNGSSLQVIEDGTSHVKLFQAMKKEYKFIRILFRQIFDQVAAVDELNQATTRLRLRYEGEDYQVQTIPTSKKALSSGVSQKLDKILNIHVVERNEVLYKLEQMHLDANIGQESLAIHFGQLMYLNSLKTQGYGKKGSYNNDECPICQNALGTKWTVLTCGHSYCQDCINKICPSTSVTFLCPLCRISLKTAEISFVDTNEVAEEEDAAGPSKATESPVEIVGSHSTKVKAVVSQLLKLQESNPGEKVIVFSNWADVLEILCRAFEENQIKYCLLSTQNFQKDLKLFKTLESVQVLLMPLSFGAKGLNLIEATHVFLVEPILSKASELQAIGRVHRIGQTKPTFVHRFFIRNTIEEKLFEILKLHDISSDDEGSLSIQDLKDMVSP